MKGDNIYGFYSHRGPDGYLSNWYQCHFVENGIHFTSTEQYMMYRKAMLFGDMVIADKIMKTSEPKDIKAFGREVHNFNSQVWDAHKFQVMVRGLYWKFSQNPVLAEKLKSTGNKILVECSPYDRIWGIGISLKDPDHKDPGLWKGQNLLGQSLMEVRRMLNNPAEVAL